MSDFQGKVNFIWSTADIEELRGELEDNLGMIGKIKRVPLREVWKHEALDFTTWLRDNLDVINEVLPDTVLTSAEREQAAGSLAWIWSQKTSPATRS